ncbi:MAG TPA: hypothetical protein VIJ96_02385 [Acidothermaceae bacterium]
MSGRRDRSSSSRSRSLLVVLGIFGASALAASLAFHNTIGTALASTYLVVIVSAGSVLMWRRRI